MSEKRDVTIDNKFGRQVIKIEFKKKKSMYRPDYQANNQVSEAEIKKKQDVLRRAEETGVNKPEERAEDIESQKRRAAFFGDRRLLREIKTQQEVKDVSRKPFHRPSYGQYGQNTDKPFDPTQRPRYFGGQGSRSFNPQARKPFEPGSRPPFGSKPFEPGSRPPFGSKPFEPGARGPRSFEPRPFGPRPFVPGSKPFGPRPPRNPDFQANRSPRPQDGRPPKLKLNEFKLSKVMSQLTQQVKSAPIVRKQLKKPMSKTTENPTKNRVKISAHTPQLGHRFLGEIHSPEDVEIDTERARSVSSVKRLLEKQRRTGKNVAKVIREIVVFDDMPVLALAHLMAVSLDTVLAKARGLGLSISKDAKLSTDESYVLVEEFGHKYKKRVEILDNIAKDAGELQDYINRAPVVTVVGHVDHGKTSLLDALRATQFTAAESGGITQSIGASQVALPDGRFITFIDTPGHEIFTEMRARGVNITDIVLLIIAADDGIKEQTIESIQHAQAAKASIIVVITKADKPGSNIDKIKQMLMNYNIVVESLGGDTPDIDVSAKTGYHLEDLLELILLQAEMMDLKSNPKPKASGNVIEAYMDKNLGPVATVLIRNGTLQKGDAFLSGMTHGRVRAIHDWQTKALTTAGPSVPVRISGFAEVPVAGDDFIVMPEANAKEASAKRRELSNVANFSILKVDAHYSISDIWKELTGNKGVMEMNFIIKADSSGSCEAISGAIDKVNNPKVKTSVILKSIGAVTDSDILLAKASQATVIAFKTEVKPGILKNAENWKVSVKRYEIIYQILDDIDQEINQTFAEKEKEVSLGRAEIREIFVKHKIGTIAGSIVTEGIIKRDAKCILWRNGVQIYTSTIQSIRQFRDDKREVKNGQECGIMIAKFSDYHIGDVIECVHKVAITPDMG